MATDSSIGDSLSLSGSFEAQPGAPHPVVLTGPPKLPPKLPSSKPAVPATPPPVEEELSIDAPQIEASDEAAQW